MPRPIDSPAATTLSRALTGAVAAVREAAAIARAASQRRRGTAPRRKGTGDFVTATDVRLERLLRRRLGGVLPEAGFLGEETDARGLDRDAVWVVDPIDGTSNFANGLPHWAVAVALLWRRRPVVAAIWCEPEGALYTAVHARGARREGRLLRPPRARWDDGAIVGCQWHRGQQQMDFLARLQRDGARVRTFGCTVVQLADVASGRLDGNVQQQGRIWDIAAPGLVLLEAGGAFTDWDGVPVFPLADLDVGHVPTIGASPDVHRRILRRVRSPAARR
ncbi:MAG: inositol monophosphatase [Planctomycetota bacterium]